MPGPRPWASIDRTCGSRAIKWHRRLRRLRLGEVVADRGRRCRPIRVLGDVSVNDLGEIEAQGFGGPVAARADAVPADKHIAQLVLGINLRASAALSTDDIDEENVDLWSAGAGQNAAEQQR